MFYLIMQDLATEIVGPFETEREAEAHVEALEAQPSSEGDIPMTNTIAKSLWVPIDEETARSVVGEGLHTGLRKGTDAPEAHDLWTAIRGSNRAWSDAVDYCIWGLGEMGLAICERKKP